MLREMNWGSDPRERGCLTYHVYLESRTLNAYDDDDFLNLKNMDVAVGIL